MRILITGHRGMLGTALCRALKQHDLILPAKHQLNIANRGQVEKFKGKKPELIIHLAGETDHEYCEANPSQCYFVNTVATGFMTNLAWELDIPIIYQSTASIFDGKNGEPYTIDDKPNPINHYNTSKYYGELLVKGYEKHIIIRSGWMFGGGRGVDKKFVAKIIEKIERGDKEIQVCTDCIGSPTYSLDLADTYNYMIEIGVPHKTWGTYNCVNESERGVSRYEFALAIVHHLKSDVTITPCVIDDLKEEFPCKRTNYEVLANGLKMRDWDSALKGYIYANYRH